MPSWFTPISRTVTDERLRAYRASGDLKPCVKFSQDLRGIAVRGMFVDTVESVLRPFESRQDLLVKLLCTREFQDEALYATKRCLPEAELESLEDLTEGRLSNTLPVGGVPKIDLRATREEYRNMYREINARSRDLSVMERIYVDRDKLAEGVQPYVHQVWAILV